MARYSFAVYGTPGLKYGQVENNRSYYNANLRARSISYKTVDIRWSSILTDPLRPQPTHWKLVRNYQGASDSPYEGVIVDSGPINSFRNSAIDTAVLPNVQATYSFWLYDGQDWINCGDSTTITVEEDLTPTLIKLEKWIPSTWLNASVNEGDAVGEPETNDFTKILSAYAFAYDKLRAEANLLELSTDYKYTPIQLLKTKIEERGFTYEPTLGDTYHRGVYRVSEAVHATKGTLAGIISYTTALTHWTSRVEVGHNIMLDYNDSSFEESIGRWVTIGSTTSGVTITQHLYANSATQFGSVINPPTPSYTNPNTSFAPRANGFGVINYPNSVLAEAAISIGSATADPILYGSPVIGGKTYSFSGWFRKTGTSNIQVGLYIGYFDKAGVNLGTTAVSAFNNPTATWTKYSATDLAPDAAAYAILRIFTNTTTAGTNNKLFMDMFQFEEYKPSTYFFEDARKVLVYVNGDKVNYLPNPSFETNTATWSAHNGTLSVVTTPSYAVSFGSKAGKFEVTNAELAGITSDWIPIDPGKNFTFSAYVSGPAPKQIYARVEFSALQSAEEQTKILSDAEGQYFPIEDYYVDSDPVLLDTQTQRIVISGVSPTYTVDAGYPSVKVSLFLPDAEVGDIFYADALLLEDGVLPTTYFDGSGAPQPLDPINNEVIESNDCLWEDETNSKGKSYRWNNYQNKYLRLYDTLPLVLPHGCSWEIRSGFPTPAYPELESVLESPSFEQNTDGWNGENATVTRTVTRGSIFDEYATHGVAFGKVVATTSGIFGVESDIYPIDTLAGYYGAAAIKPENEDAHGDYTVTLKFYDFSKTFITSKDVTVSIHRSDRWAYLATFARKSEIVGAFYASVEVKCDPEFPGVGRTFYLDRVVFRQ